MAGSLPTARQMSEAAGLVSKGADKKEIPMNRVQSPIINQQFGANEGRMERLETQAGKQLINGFTRIFGGPQKLTEMYTKQQADEEWLNRMPGPHQGEGSLTAFSLFLESGPHGDQHYLIEEWANKYGVKTRGNFALPFVDMGWGMKPTAKHWMVVNHPEDHLKIGEEHVMKSPTYDVISYPHSFVAVGATDPMEVSEDGEWRRRRLGAVHVVQPTHIKTYFHRMERWVRTMVRNLQDERYGTFLYGGATPTPAYNIHNMMADLTFKIGASNLWGLNDETLEAWSLKIRWALQRPEGTAELAKKIMREWVQVLRDVPQEKAGPLLQAFRDEKAEPPSASFDPEGKFGGPEQAEFDDLCVLTLAMHDTTASTMTTCMMELARRPEFQEKVAEEAQMVLAQRASGAMEYDDLYKMPLVTKCINETLRLWTVLPFGSQRQLMHDELLHCGPGPDDTVLVPKGTSCMIPNHVHHRSKELWGEDADEWKPERWDGFGDKDGIHFGEASHGVLDANSRHNETASVTYAARNPESARFHPFTRAPRDCFGKNFAQAEMRVILPVLLSQLEFTLAEPTKTQAETNIEKIIYQLTGILKPRDGLWVHVQPRKPLVSASGSKL